MILINQMDPPRLELVNLPSIFSGETEAALLTLLFAKSDKCSHIPVCFGSCLLTEVFLYCCNIIQLPIKDLYALFAAERRWVW